MWVTMKINNWGSSSKWTPPPFNSSPRGSSKGCRIRPLSAEDRLTHQHQAFSAPTTTPAPARAVGTVQAGCCAPGCRRRVHGSAAAEILTLISVSWRWHPPRLRCCVSSCAREKGARPRRGAGSTPPGGVAVPLHSTWGYFTWNTAGSRERKIWIRPCRLNFRIRNQILLKSHLQTNSEHSQLWD